MPETGVICDLLFLIKAQFHLSVLQSLVTGVGLTGLVSVFLDNQLACYLGIHLPTIQADIVKLDCPF